MATYRPTASPSGAADPSPEQPLTQLLSRMTGDLTTLLRKEVQLAKIEIRDDVKQTAKAGGVYGAVGFAGYMAAVLISFALAFLLDLIMATWLAFAIIGVLYAVAGYVLFRQGQNRFKEFKPVPEQTIETIKEDIEWARTRHK
jgi:hypothetical protein